MKNNGVCECVCVDKYQFYFTELVNSLIYHLINNIFKYGIHIF